jgi:CDP-2,3-bis-(O-geranylgeranyl)-sn-glycerol synthase
MDIVQTVLVGIWVFIPALLPNSAAVIFGGGRPIDSGRSWKGKRILGDGKTWGGFIGGVGSGVLVGFVQLLIAFPFDPVDFFGFGPWPTCAGVIFTLSLGALLGDMVGAFIKRRLGLERGAKATGLDQYDFVAGAMLLTLLFFPDWFLDTYVRGWSITALVAIIILVPVIHRLVNIIGFRRGLKKEPW